MESVDSSMHIDEVSETPISGSTETSEEEISTLWKFFTKTVRDKHGIERVLCKYCGCEYAVGKNPKTKNHYRKTSHLIHHVSVCESIANSYMIVGLNQDVKSGMRKINEKTLLNMLAQTIIEHDLPLSFVDNTNIKFWVKNLNSDAKTLSGSTIVSYIQKIYVNEKDKLKEAISKIPNRVCLTSDVWTATTTESYICLTAHFVDENWKLKSKILDFAPMITPYSVVELEAAVFDCLKQWGIDMKVFSITFDTSVDDNMQDILKNHLRLQNSLLCDGEFFHVRCFTDIFDLIVLEGLKVTHEALFKIRESIKYVREFDWRMMKFKECVQVAGIDTRISLSLDEPTKWCSTYMMLECAIKYKKAFHVLLVVDENYKYFPSHEEWMRAEKMFAFLEPFYDVTNLILGSSYATSNLYFMQVCMIEFLLNENLFDEDEVIRDMTMKVKGKFEKYLEEYSVILAFGAILDPRLKLDFLKFCYTKLDHSTSQEKVNCVKEKLKKLYAKYASNSNPQGASQSQLSTEEHKPKKLKAYREFKLFQNEKMSDSGRSELDFYLDEPQLHHDDLEDFDVLTYWKNNEMRFPTLSVLARDVLSIPITTATSESAFSIGGGVLTKYRSSSFPKDVQMLKCTRNWLHGFVQNPSDDSKTSSHEIILSDPLFGRILKTSA